MGPIGCPETSVRNYHYSLRINPEERSSLLHTSSASGRGVIACVVERLQVFSYGFNLIKPNDIYICRTAALTSRR